MAAPTAEQLRKFFDKFFELVERGHIESLNMDTLTASLASGMWREPTTDAECGNVRQNIWRNLWCSVDVLGLSPRALSACHGTNCQWVWQLVEKTDAELLKTKNFGWKSLTEIKYRLASLGLSLGMRLSELQLQPEPPK